MKAFQNIRTEMREAVATITHPYAGQARMPIRREPEPAEDEEYDGPVEPWMEFAFAGLTHACETGAPYALIPCFMNGEPAVVIGIARTVGRRTHITPLFLACQPWMKFSSEPGDSSDGEEGGGPDRTDPGDSPAPR